MTGRGGLEVTYLSVPAVCAVRRILGTNVNVGTAPLITCIKGQYMAI